MLLFPGQGTRCCFKFWGLRGGPPRFSLHLPLPSLPRAGSGSPAPTGLGWAQACGPPATFSLQLGSVTTAYSQGGELGPAEREGPPVNGSEPPCPFVPPCRGTSVCRHLRPKSQSHGACVDGLLGRSAGVRCFQLPRLRPRAGGHSPPMRPHGDATKAKTFHACWLSRRNLGTHCGTVEPRGPEMSAGPPCPVRAADVGLPRPVGAANRRPMAHPVWPSRGSTDPPGGGLNPSPDGEGAGAGRCASHRSSRASVRTEEALRLSDPRGNERLCSVFIKFLRSHICLNRGNGSQKCRGKERRPCFVCGVKQDPRRLCRSRPATHAPRCAAGDRRRVTS